jgi:hypothetical protein
MATNINRKMIISTKLTKSNLDSEINRVFKPNASQMDTYKLRGGNCYKWVKNALADLGIYQNGPRNIHAWDSFISLAKSEKMKYFTNEFANPSLKESKSYPYHSVINDKMAIVYGTFIGSKWGDTFKTTLELNDIDDFIKNNLTLYKKTAINEDLNVITHVGLYANKQFYDFADNKIRASVTSSFIPISYYEIYNDLYQKLPN